jgi:hypothetical protein
MKNGSNWLVIFLLFCVLILEIVILVMVGGGFGGKPVSTPTPVPPTVMATPNLGATATASCKQFQSQYPSTPCP